MAQGNTLEEDATKHERIAVYRGQIDARDGFNDGGMFTAHVVHAQRTELRWLAAYFLGTDTGRYRSSRIVPEPFFVHSELTTGVFLADLAAYVLGWACRWDMVAPACRQDLRPYAAKLYDMQFHGDKPRRDGSGVWKLNGIVYLDDLRGKFAREEDETGA